MLSFVSLQRVILLFPTGFLHILPCPLFPFLPSGYSSFILAGEEAAT